MGTLKGEDGAGLSPAHAIAPTPTSHSPACPRTCRGARVSARRPRAPSAGTVARSSSAWASSSASVGSGRGTQSLPSAAGGVASGETSKSTEVMSTPLTPSTRAWWVFEMIAKRSPSSPSTRLSSHSGLVRSSGRANSRPARLRSCSSEPGAGSALWRTW